MALLLTRVPWRKVPNDEWDLAGTPCEDVLKGNTCHHPMDVRHKFPTDPGSADVESYLGVPLRDAVGGDMRTRIAR